MSDAAELAGFDPHLLTGAEEALAHYFGLDGSPAFTGARFSTYGHNHRTRITGDDLIATCLLSITVSAPRKGLSGWTRDHFVAIADRGDEIADLLSELPAGSDLHELDEVTARSLVGWEDQRTPGRRLYELLRRGLGKPEPSRVAVYKLLARKRPHLFPIRDTVVERAVGHATPDTWWMPWWHSLTRAPEAITMLDEARSHVPEPLRPSLLRTADIVLWMQHRS